MYYTATTEELHTFDIGDNITLTRQLNETVSQAVRWRINGVAYPVAAENTNLHNEFTVPASALVDGINTISMVVNYSSDPNTESVYTGTVWRRAVPLINDKTVIICSGETFEVIPDGGETGEVLPPGTEYTWTVLPAESMTVVSGQSDEITPQDRISQTLTNHTHGQQIVTYTVTPWAGTVQGGTFEIEVTVNPQPSISSPQTHTICSGDPFDFTPTGAPLGTVYQWTVTADGDVDGEVSNNSTWENTINGAALTNKTNIAKTVQYSVTPKLGDCTGTNFLLNLTVNPRPSITTKLVPICSGETFSLTPSNGGSDIVPNGTVYQWRVMSSNGVNGAVDQTSEWRSLINGAALTNNTNSPKTVEYSVTPKSGDCTGNSFVMNVRVDPKPSITTKTISICSGEPFSCTPLHDNPAGDIVPDVIEYKWEVTDANGVTGAANQAGWVSTTISGSALSHSESTTKTVAYSVTPKSGNCEGTPFTLNVDVKPKPHRTTKSGTVCSGITYNLPTLSTPPEVAPASTTKYSWLPPLQTGITGITDGNKEAFSQTLTNTTNAPITVTYNVTPWLGDCSGDEFEVNITVNPKPQISTQNTTICSGESFSVTPLNGAGGDIVPTNMYYKYEIKHGNGNLTGVTGKSYTAGQTITGGPLTNKTSSAQPVTYSVTPRWGVSPSCEGTAFDLEVTVNPKPDIKDKETVICSGETFNVTPADGVNNDIVPSGTKYTWEVLIPNDYVDGENAETYQKDNISQQLTNITNIQQRVEYTVTPTAPNCPAGATFKVTVFVNPMPSIATQEHEICSKQQYDLIPDASDIVPQNIMYSWTTTSTGSLTGSNPSGTANAFTQTLTNPTGSVQTIVYTLTPTVTMDGVICTGASFDITLKVNPTDGMTLTSDQEINPICSGDNVSYTATSNVVGVNFSWERLANIDILEQASSGADASINETLTSKTGTTTTVTYIFKLEKGICINLETVTVKVYGKLNGGNIGIAGTAKKKDTVCHNSAPKQLTLSGVAGGIGSYTYQWQSKPVGADAGDAWTDIQGINTPTYTPPAPLTESLMYRVETTDSKCDAIHSDTAMIIVEPVSMLVYPDLRIYTCNNLPTRLSQFIDSTGIRNIDWTPVGVAPAISIDGKIAADVLQAGATYTYTYAVTNACTSGVKSKIYLHVLGKNKDFHLRTDTVAVCYLHANNLQINRIFGLDDDGEITYTGGAGVEPFMVKPVAPSAYEGSLVFNGKDAYNAGVLQSITYHGDSGAKEITFTYKTADDGCLKGKEYKVVVVLTFF